MVNTAEEAAAILQLLPGRARIPLVTSAFHICFGQCLFERQGFKVLPFPVDFLARGRRAGPLCCDPTQWLPSARALDDNSRALRELIGRFVVRSWCFLLNLSSPAEVVDACGRYTKLVTGGAGFLGSHLVDR